MSRRKTAGHKRQTRQHGWPTIAEQEQVAQETELARIRVREAAAMADPEPSWLERRRGRRRRWICASRDHEACHGAAATLVGIEVDGYAFDRMGWDGWVGQTLLNHDALQALEGTYQDRLALATRSFMHTSCCSRNRKARATSDSSTRCGRTTTPARCGGSSSNITPAGS
jgi:hypothetical protein